MADLNKYLAEFDSIGDSIQKVADVHLALQRTPKEEKLVCSRLMDLENILSNIINNQKRILTQMIAMNNLLGNQSE